MHSLFLFHLFLCLYLSVCLLSFQLFPYLPIISLLWTFCPCFPMNRQKKTGVRYHVNKFKAEFILLRQDIAAQTVDNRERKLDSFSERSSSLNVFVIHPLVRPLTQYMALYEKSIKCQKVVIVLAYINSSYSSVFLFVNFIAPIVNLSLFS